MTMTDSPWQLFRYHQGDGSRKDWAYRRLADGAMEIAWGRSGHIGQQQHYRADQRGLIEQRAREKERKGYVPLGQAVLRGRVFEIVSTQRAALQHQPVPEPRPQPRVDLSWIAPGQENLWF
ncbi:hypothetical protein Thi970DRAFT_00065 [Thiorhodovibrio frisius]|uniref:WGR domain-containing protein n=2 Tax=Thiorhodovibrio frisius TaxID=631362 RepID=H8YVJ0_9GAMM|nr:hypothetical protein Thi970DRAFT_00065 [Thiorhodovibrio frisius]WPL23005.1 hypothetical protein Thiofri_03185 [Thiorhodovibrio frisius]